MKNPKHVHVNRDKKLNCR